MNKTIFSVAAALVLSVGLSFAVGGKDSSESAKSVAKAACDGAPMALGSSRSVCK